MNKQMIIRQYVVRQFRQLGCAMNEKLTLIGTLLAKHCEFIAAQRARRACQICTLYRHIYTEATFRSMVNRFAANYGSRLRYGRNTPFGMLLGAAFFSWEKEKITEDELERYILMEEEEAICSKSQNSCIGFGRSWVQF